MGHVGSRVRIRAMVAVVMFLLVLSTVSLHASGSVVYESLSNEMASSMSAFTVLFGRRHDGNGDVHGGGLDDDDVVNGGGNGTDVVVSPETPPIHVHAQWVSADVTFSVVPSANDYIASSSSSGSSGTDDVRNYVAVVTDMYGGPSENNTVVFSSLWSDTDFTNGLRLVNGHGYTFEYGGENSTSNHVDSGEFANLDEFESTFERCTWIDDVPDNIADSDLQNLPSSGGHITEISSSAPVADVSFDDCYWNSVIVHQTSGPRAGLVSVSSSQPLLEWDEDSDGYIPMVPSDDRGAWCASTDSTLALSQVSVKIHDSVMDARFVMRHDRQFPDEELAPFPRVLSVTGVTVATIEDNIVRAHFDKYQRAFVKQMSMWEGMYSGANGDGYPVPAPMVPSPPCEIEEADIYRYNHGNMPPYVDLNNVTRHCASPFLHRSVDDIVRNSVATRENALVSVVPVMKSCNGVGTTCTSQLSVSRLDMALYTHMSPHSTDETVHADGVYPPVLTPWLWAGDRNRAFDNVEMGQMTFVQLPVEPPTGPNVPGSTLLPSSGFELSEVVQTYTELYRQTSIVRLFASRDVNIHNSGWHGGKCAPGAVPPDAMGTVSEGECAIMRHQAMISVDMVADRDEYGATAAIDGSPPYYDDGESCEVRMSSNVLDGVFEYVSFATLRTDESKRCKVQINDNIVRGGGVGWVSDRTLFDVRAGTASELFKFSNNIVTNQHRSDVLDGETHVKEWIDRVSRHTFLLSSMLLRPHETDYGNYMPTMGRVYWKDIISNDGSNDVAYVRGWIISNLDSMVVSADTATLFNDHVNALNSAHSSAVLSLRSAVARPLSRPSVINATSPLIGDEPVGVCVDGGDVGNPYDVHGNVVRGIVYEPHTYSYGLELTRSNRTAECYSDDSVGAMVEMDHGPWFVGAFAIDLTGDPCSNVSITDNQWDKFQTKHVGHRSLHYRNRNSIHEDGFIYDADKLAPTDYSFKAHAALHNYIEEVFDIVSVPLSLNKMEREMIHRGFDVAMSLTVQPPSTVSVVGARSVSVMDNIWSDLVDTPHGIDIHATSGRTVSVDIHDNTITHRSIDDGFGACGNTISPWDFREGYRDDDGNDIDRPDADVSPQRSSSFVRVTTGRADVPLHISVKDNKMTMDAEYARSHGVPLRSVTLASVVPFETMATAPLRVYAHEVGVIMRDFPQLFSNFLRDIVVAAVTAPYMDHLMRVYMGYSIYVDNGQGGDICDHVMWTDKIGHSIHGWDVVSDGGETFEFPFITPHDLKLHAIDHNTIDIAQQDGNTLSSVEIRQNRVEWVSNVPHDDVGTVNFASSSGIGAAGTSCRSHRPGAGRAALSQPALDVVMSGPNSRTLVRRDSMIPFEELRSKNAGRYVMSHSAVALVAATPYVPLKRLDMVDNEVVVRRSTGSGTIVTAHTRHTPDGFLWDNVVYIAGADYIANGGLLVQNNAIEGTSFVSSVARDMDSAPPQQARQFLALPVPIRVGILMTGIVQSVHADGGYAWDHDLRHDDRTVEMALTRLWPQLGSEASSIIAASNVLDSTDDLFHHSGTRYGAIPRALLSFNTGISGRAFVHDVQFEPPPAYNAIIERASRIASDSDSEDGMGLPIIDGVGYVYDGCHYVTRTVPNRPQGVCIATSTDSGDNSVSDSFASELEAEFSPMADGVCYGKIVFDSVNDALYKCHMPKLYITPPYVNERALVIGSSDPFGALVGRRFLEPAGSGQQQYEFENNVRNVGLTVETRYGVDNVVLDPSAVSAASGMPWSGPGAPSVSGIDQRTIVTLRAGRAAVEGTHVHTRAFISGGVDTGEFGSLTDIVPRPISVVPHMESRFYNGSAWDHTPYIMRLDGLRIRGIHMVLNLDEEDWTKHLLSTAVLMGGDRDKNDKVIGSLPAYSAPRMDYLVFDNCWAEAIYGTQFSPDVTIPAGAYMDSSMLQLHGETHGDSDVVPLRTAANEFGMFAIIGGTVMRRFDSAIQITGSDPQVTGTGRSEPHPVIVDRLVIDDEVQIEMARAGVIHVAPRRHFVVDGLTCRDCMPHPDTRAMIHFDGAYGGVVADGLCKHGTLPSDGVPMPATGPCVLDSVSLLPPSEVYDTSSLMSVLRIENIAGPDLHMTNIATADTAPMDPSEPDTGGMVMYGLVYRNVAAYACDFSTARTIKEASGDIVGSIRDIVCDLVLPEQDSDDPVTSGFSCSGITCLSDVHMLPPPASCVVDPSVVSTDPGYSYTHFATISDALEYCRSEDPRTIEITSGVYDLRSERLSVGTGSVVQPIPVTDPVSVDGEEAIFERQTLILRGLIDGEAGGFTTSSSNPGPPRYPVIIGSGHTFHRDIGHIVTHGVNGAIGVVIENMTFVDECTVGGVCPSTVPDTTMLSSWSVRGTVSANELDYFVMDNVRIYAFKHHEQPQLPPGVIDASDVGQWSVEAVYKTFIDPYVDKDASQTVGDGVNRYMSYEPSVEMGVNVRARRATVLKDVYVHGSYSLGVSLVQTFHHEFIESPAGGADNSWRPHLPFSASLADRLWDDVSGAVGDDSGGITVGAIVSDIVSNVMYSGHETRFYPLTHIIHGLHGDHIWGSVLYMGTVLRSIVHNVVCTEECGGYLSDNVVIGNDAARAVVTVREYVPGAGDPTIHVWEVPDDEKPAGNVEVWPVPSNAYMWSFSGLELVAGTMSADGGDPEPPPYGSPFRSGGTYVGNLAALWIRGAGSLSGVDIGEHVSDFKLRRVKLRGYPVAVRLSNVDPDLLQMYNEPPNNMPLFLPDQRRHMRELMRYSSDDTSNVIENMSGTVYDVRLRDPYYDITPGPQSSPQFCNDLCPPGSDGGASPITKCFVSKSFSYGANTPMYGYIRFSEISDAIQYCIYDRIEIVDPDHYENIDVPYMNYAPSVTRFSSSGVVDPDVVYIEAPGWRLAGSVAPGRIHGFGHRIRQSHYPGNDKILRRIVFRGVEFVADTSVRRDYVPMEYEIQCANDPDPGVCMDNVVDGTMHSFPHFGAISDTDHGVIPAYRNPELEYLVDGTVCQWGSESSSARRRHSSIIYITGRTPNLQGWSGPGLDGQDGLFATLDQVTFQDVRFTMPLNVSVSGIGTSEPADESDYEGWYKRYVRCVKQTNDNDDAQVVSAVYCDACRVHDLRMVRTVLEVRDPLPTYQSGDDESSLEDWPQLAHMFDPRLLSAHFTHKSSTSSSEPSRLPHVHALSYTNDRERWSSYAVTVESSSISRIDSSMPSSQRALRGVTSRKWIHIEGFLNVRLVNLDLWSCNPNPPMSVRKPGVGYSEVRPYGYACVSVDFGTGEGMDEGGATFFDHVRNRDLGLNVTVTGANVVIENVRVHSVYDISSGTPVFNGVIGNEYHSYDDETTDNYVGPRIIDGHDDVLPVQNEFNDPYYYSGIELVLYGVNGLPTEYESLMPYAVYVLREIARDIVDNDVTSGRNNGARIDFGIHITGTHVSSQIICAPSNHGYSSGSETPYLNPDVPDGLLQPIAAVRAIGQNNMNVHGRMHDVVLSNGMHSLLDDLLVGRGRSYALSCYNCDRGCIPRFGGNGDSDSVSYIVSFSIIGVILILCFGFCGWTCLIDRDMIGGATEIALDAMGDPDISEQNEKKNMLRDGIDQINSGNDDHPVQIGTNMELVQRRQYRNNPRYGGYNDGFHGDEYIYLGHGSGHGGPTVSMSGPRWQDYRGGGGGGESNSMELWGWDSDIKKRKDEQAIAHMVHEYRRTVKRVPTVEDRGDLRAMGDRGVKRRHWGGR